MTDGKTLEKKKFCLERLADQVSRFWYGAHLHLSVIEDTSTPSMDWYTVNFPMTDLHKPEHVQLATLYHEWGHRAISPESPEMSRVWGLLVLDQLSDYFFLSDDEKVTTNIHLIIINMLTDLWVDKYYLDHDKIGEFYLKATEFNLGLAGSLMNRAFQEMKMEFEEDPSLKEDFAQGYSLFILFIDLYRALVTEKKCGKAVFDNPMVRQAYTLIFDEKQSCERRIRSFVELVESILPKRSEFIHLIQVNGISTPDGDDVPVDANTIIKLMKKHGIQAGGPAFKTVFGIKQGTDLYIRIKEMELYAEVIDTVERVHRLGMKRRVQAGFSSWRVGQKLTDLLEERVIERFGRIIPNVNTLKRNYMRIGRESDKSGTANICLVADDSGSIAYGDTLVRLHEAMFSIVLAAEKRLDQVSMIVFGSDVSYYEEPSSDYDNLKRAIISIEGGSGGTVLGSALEQAIEYAMKVEKQTTFLFTDTYIFESVEDLRPTIGRLSSLSKIVVFAFSETEQDAGEFKTYFEGSNARIYFVSHGIHFYEASLKEVYA